MNWTLLALGMMNEPRRWVGGVVNHVKIIACELVMGSGGFGMIRQLRALYFLFGAFLKVTPVLEPPDHVATRLSLRG